MVSLAWTERGQWLALTAEADLRRPMFPVKGAAVTTSLPFLYQATSLTSAKLRFN
jgi:hypothetical protein